jgi:hypothetical protein
VQVGRSARTASLSAWACVGVLALVSTGCSVPTDDLPHPGTCGALQLVDLVPAPDAHDVPGDVTLTLTFSDFPDPDTISTSTVVLFTGFYYHTGRYWVDLVDRRARFRPSGPLTPDLGYTLVIRPGIRSLRGCKLEPPPALAGGTRPAAYSFYFQIASEGAAPPADPPPPAATYRDVVGIFARHCAGSSCHLDVAGGRSADDPSACLAEEAAGGRLSLCAAEAHGNLVGVPSRQIARLVRVAPRDSARSYLLRKLLGAPPVVGHLGVPNDTLTDDELHALQSWIDTGARLPPPPPADGGAPEGGNDGGGNDGGSAPGP